MNSDTEDTINVQSIEKSWFWIALISFTNFVYTIASTTVFFNIATELEENVFSMINGSFTIVTAAVVILAPMLLGRLGILEDLRKLRWVFAALSAAGIISIVVFTLILGLTPDPDIIWLALILAFVSMVMPAALAGCAIYRVIKVISGKFASRFSGFCVILTMVITLVCGITFVIISELVEVSYYYFAAMNIVIYAVMLIIPVIMMFKNRNKDSFGYTAPESAEYFPDKLFRKFMVLALLIQLVD